MKSEPVEYLITEHKSIVDKWSKKNNFDAEESLSIHLDCLTESKKLKIHTVYNVEEAIILEISTEKYADPKEFLLTPDDRLLWSMEDNVWPPLQSPKRDK